MTFPRSRMEHQLELFEEMAERDRKLMRERFPDPVLGEVEPSDEEFVDWFMMKIRQYPPQRITFPNGITRTMSPWAAALMFAEGGNELIERFHEITS